jgi:hypothetical protein
MYYLFSGLLLSVFLAGDVVASSCPPKTLLSLFLRLTSNSLLLSSGPSQLLLPNQAKRLPRHFNFSSLKWLLSKLHLERKLNWKLYMVTVRERRPWEWHVLQSAHTKGTWNWALDLGCKGPWGSQPAVPAKPAPCSHYTAKGTRCPQHLWPIHLWHVKYTHLSRSPGTSLVFGSLNHTYSMMILQRFHSSCGNSGQAHLFLHKN